MLLNTVSKLATVHMTVRGDESLSGIRSFGQLLKSLIKSNGFTQAEFRRQINISKTYLVDIEKGDAFPPPELQIRMADKLDLDKTTRAAFYDLAASGRGELPTDVFNYLFQNDGAIYELRERMRK